MDCKSLCFAVSELAIELVTSKHFHSETKCLLEHRRAAEWPKGFLNFF